MRLDAVLACLAVLLLPPLAAQAEAPPPSLAAPLQRDHPLVGRIWLPAQNRFVAVEDLVARAKAADYALLGETHDNPDHHALQAWLVRRLTADGDKPAIAFEMIDNTQAPALAAHLAAHPGDAAGLGAALDWAKSGWPDWDAHYRPVAQAGLDNGATLHAANLSRDDTKEIAKGGVPAAWAGRLGLERPQSPEDRQAMEVDIQNGHCGMLPDRALPAMVRVQRARDAVMARALADWPRAILIAGAGHVRADRAVPRHVADMAPGRAVLALAFVEVSADKRAPQDYAAVYDAERLPFDAVWFTARAERADPCESFRKHMEKKKE